MNTKEMIISNVLEKMEKHLSKDQITILEQTLICYAKSSENFALFLSISAS